MKDYLTIKEFSQLSGIETTALRYWDDIGLFSPAKRDLENNYRYYTAEQIVAVNFIAVLSNLNVPLKTIAQMTDRSPEKTAKLIEQQEKLLDREMQRLRDCYSIIHTRREMIYEGIQALEGFYVLDGIRQEARARAPGAEQVGINDITVLQRESLAYIRGLKNVFKEGERFYESFIKFCGNADLLRINLNFPIYGMHESLPGFLKAPGQPDYFISMDPAGNCEIESGRYLIGFTRGNYGELGNLPERLATYAREHSIITSGPVYTMYLLEETCTKDPSQYLAQVSVAVSR